LYWYIFVVWRFHRYEVVLYQLTFKAKVLKRYSKKAKKHFET
jgi:hypothetical protein